MATIKSYSDLQQSKKLAEILPLESADMYYWLAWSGGVSKEQRNTPKVGTPNKDAIKTYWCPCWSLASLFGVLPKRIELEGVAYELSIYLNGLYYWNVNNGNLLLEVKGKDNLVDACVAMIEKLHELKML